MNLFNACRRRQIKAKSEIDDRPDNRRGCDIGTPEGVLQFNREFESTKRVGFPEIDSGTEPVVIVYTFLKRFAGDKPLGDGLVASVVSEHESCRQSVQFLPVSFGKLSVGRVGPQLDKSLPRGFFRFRDFLEICLTRFLEPVRIGLVQNPRAIHNHFLFRLFLFLAHSVTISFCEANTPRRKAAVQHRLVRFDTPPGPFNSRTEGIPHRATCQFLGFLESSPTSTKAASRRLPGAFWRRLWRSR